MDIKQATILFMSVALCYGQAVEDLNKDLQPEATQRRIQQIIQDHENYKYGGHGGHEYGDNDQPKVEERHRPRYAYQHPVAIKKKVPQGGHGYYITLPAKPSSRYQKLQPTDSKIYAYYPKVSSHENQRPVVYYPVKGDSVEESSEEYSHDGSAPHGYHTTNKVYLVPEHKESAKYVAPSPHHVISPPHRAVPPPHHALPPPHHALPPPHHALPPPHRALPPPHHVVVPAPKKHYVVPKTNLEESEHQYGADHQGSAHYGQNHHGYHGDRAIEKEQGHHAHKDYDEAGHKSHASQAGHHDHNSKYHNKGSYERDRGYHYEKAYAYDKIRAHHDIGKSHDSHSDYKAQHAQQGHHKKGHHGAHSFMYFKKADRHGGHGYGKHGHVLNKHGQFKKARDYSVHTAPVHHVSHYHR